MLAILLLEAADHHPLGGHVSLVNRAQCFGLNRVFQRTPEGLGSHYSIKVVNSETSNRLLISLQGLAPLGDQ